MGRVRRAQSAPGPDEVLKDQLRETSFAGIRQLQTEQETEIEKKAA
jgi:hypothetical protein